MKTPINKLKPKTRIKLISLSSIDGWKDKEEDVVNKEYEAFESEEYYSTAFRQEGTGNVFVFVNGASYEII